MPILKIIFFAEIKFIFIFVFEKYIFSAIFIFFSGRIYFWFLKCPSFPMAGSNKVKIEETGNKHIQATAMLYSSHCRPPCYIQATAMLYSSHRHVMFKPLPCYIQATAMLYSSHRHVIFKSLPCYIQATAIPYSSHCQQEDTSKHLAGPLHKKKTLDNGLLYKKVVNF